MPKYLPAPTSFETTPPHPERRRSERVRLSLDTAVPVIVRSGGLVQWGVARNISEGGMLIELESALPMGARVEVKLAGVEGSRDAPEPALLTGEVRHHVCWSFGARDGRGRLHGVGVRFTTPPPSAPEVIGPIH